MRMRSTVQGQPSRLHSLGAPLHSQTSAFVVLPAVASNEHRLVQPKLGHYVAVQCLRFATRHVQACTGRCHVHGIPCAIDGAEAHTRCWQSYLCNRLHTVLTCCMLDQAVKRVVSTPLCCYCMGEPPAQTSLHVPPSPPAPTCCCVCCLQAPGCAW